MDQVLFLHAHSLFCFMLGLWADHLAFVSNGYQWQAKIHIALGLKKGFTSGLKAKWAYDQQCVCLGSHHPSPYFKNLVGGMDNYHIPFFVIYEAFCLDVAWGCMNRAPNEGLLV